MASSTKPHLTIRRATRADIPALIAIQISSFQDMNIFNTCFPRRHSVPEGYAWRAIFQQRCFAADSKCHIYIGTRDDTGEPVCYAAWQEYVSPTCPAGWKRDEEWWLPVERALLDVEDVYRRWVTDRITDFGAWERLGKALKREFGEWEKVPHLDLKHLAVAPQAQGMGFGRALLEHGLEAARVEGLIVTLFSTTPAVDRLYGRAGFQRMGEIVVGEGTENEAVGRVMVWRPTYEV